MRLLNTHTFKLRDFLGEARPYAILSHTWEDEEVTLQDMLSPAEYATGMKGYRKLKGSAKLASDQGFHYLWMDTCCIDKSSSAELSEAINSMFQWYKNAALCLAYLSDVQAETGLNLGESLQSSKWFTRGWTLQELLAPSEVWFFNASWKLIRTKTHLADQIARITNIPASILKGLDDLDTVSAASKMSWASSRITTRSEDIAYCLLGLFDVKMPLLYGEGEQKAFIRLQEEFLKSSDDETIFAWQVDDRNEAASKPYWGLLATSPKYFLSSSTLRSPQFKSRIDNQPTDVTNRGLRIKLPMTLLDGDESETIYLALLQCERTEASL
ncbi:heterokaryon incompatibility protein-domain-containing protein, partial [Podospora didyma]